MLRLLEKYPIKMFLEKKVLNKVSAHKCAQLKFSPIFDIMKRHYHSANNSYAHANIL